MSLKPLPCFTAICDWPGCESDVCASTDYSGWDIDGIENEIDNAVDYGWRRGRNPHEIYCDKHPSIRTSEVEDGDPPPERPYLLVHDGDFEDGYTTLVMTELEDPSQPALPFGAES